MTKAVIVCSPEDSVTDVMKLMTQHRTRHVPVKDHDQLVGIISMAMFSSTVLESCKGKQTSFGTMPLLPGDRGLSQHARGFFSLPMLCPR